MLNNVSSSGTSEGTLTKFSKCVNGKINLLANIPITVLNANSKRMYAAFVNNGNEDITLVLEDKSKAILEEGIVIKGRGGSYELTLSNLYVGKVSAISAFNAHISFVEGIE